MARLAERFGGTRLRQAESMVGDAHRVLSKLQLIAALVIGLPLLLLVGFFGSRHYLAGEADLHVVAPASDGVRVLLDNTAHDLQPGETLCLRPKRGPHTLAVTRPALQAKERYSFAVSSGYWDGVVVLPGQCLVQMDVTGVLYEDDDPEPVLGIEASFGQAGVWELERSTYRSLGELPRHTGGRVRVLQEVPCDLLAGDEEALRQALLRILGVRGP